MPRKKTDNTALPEQESLTGMEESFGNPETEFAIPAEDADSTMFFGSPEDTTVRERESSGTENTGETWALSGIESEPETLAAGLDVSDIGRQDTADPDLSDGWPHDDEISPYGDLSVPLDIERRLEEELAALEAATAEAESPSQEEPEPDVSATGLPAEAEPEKPAKRKTAARRGKIAADTPTAEDVAPESSAVEDGVQKELEPAARQNRRAIAVAGPKVPAASPRPASGFYQTNFNRLDRNLSDEERQEWNEIYASFRSQSILTGTVAGVDQNRLPVRNTDGTVETRVISSLVIIAYRVKVLIPENAVWMRSEERGAFVLRGMAGATVDYVISNVDREGEVALGSRTMALVKRRRTFNASRVRPGDIVPCSVLAVGPQRCLLACGGYDVSMRAPDMSYSSIFDMRETYRPGQELKARVLDYSPGEGKLRLSVKEAAPNPFDGAERRHPVGSRRRAVITGKYGGGVFCALQDGTTVLCLYSNSHSDADFLPSDNVMVHIVQYNYQRRHIYGRIVSKW